MSKKKRKSASGKTTKIPQFLVIGGLVLVIVMILMTKEGKGSVANTSNLPGNTAVIESPAEQLDRAIQSGRPTLAFFHSTTCDQCTYMIGAIAEIYPEFDQSIELVNVNVYDTNNRELLQRVGLQYIPTLIFFDRYGQGKVSVGVMEPAVLRETLAQLAIGD